MSHHVAAIIQDDIGRPELCQHAVKESRVALVADADRDLIVLVGLAGLHDINADNLSR